MKRGTLFVVLALAGCVSAGPNVDKSKLAEGYYLKGLSHLQEKNYELASVEFNRSIQTDSNYKQSYYGLGIISDYQGKLEDASKYYLLAIDKDEDYSEAHNALGVVYFKQQKWKEAVKEFNRALDNKLYTTPHVPYINLGDLYMARKDYVKAIENYRESKRFVNSEFTIIKIGTALLEAGRSHEAVKEFQEGVAIAPQDPYMRYNMALGFLKDGNKKSALAEFRKVTELSPKSEIALKAMDYIKTLR